MMDFIDNYYYGGTYHSEGYDKEKAQQKAFSIVLPLIMTNELTQKQSVCIRYKYIQGKSQAEIAQILNLSQPTVSRHINAAKEIINNSLRYCYLAIDKGIEEYDRLQQMPNI